MLFPLLLFVVDMKKCGSQSKQSVREPLGVSPSDPVGQTHSTHPLTFDPLGVSRHTLKNGTGLTAGLKIRRSHNTCNIINTKFAFNSSRR